MAAAAYEWNYQRQLLTLRVLERGERALSVAEAEDTLFSSDYLLRRPLLEAISQDRPVSPRAAHGLLDRSPRRSAAQAGVVRVWPVVETRA